MELTDTALHEHQCSPQQVPDGLGHKQETGEQEGPTLTTISSLHASDLETEKDNENAEKRDSFSIVTYPESHSSTTTPSKPTLLTLPLEIRLEILKHLLVLPPSAPPPSQNAHYHSPQPRALRLLYPAILRCNQQLYSEGLPLLYRHNTFLAHNTLLTSLPRLRRAYDPVVTERLSGLITRFHLCVRLDAEPGYDRAKATAQLSGKEEVVLEAWQAMWRGSGPDVLRLFEGVRGVRRAKVIGSVGGFEDYAKWLERAMMREVGATVEPFYWSAGSEFEPSW
ncbi:hypothetical protein F5Y06DRAFT_294802 [Hypoxylon sp. FL0890]|nr:hypothetical protein F5Y06DRAFT_294802 [Hypoxylon sp. FL0890]